MKNNMVAFRLGKGEREQLDRIVRYTRLPENSLSSVLRLAIPFVHQSISDGMRLGAADRDRAKSFDRRYERYRNANHLDFFNLGYNIGFNGELSMLYRVGKAQGEMDARNGKSNALDKPLSAESSGYSVGYFDGYHGGYLAGLAKGHADREEAEQREKDGRLTTGEASVYLPPEGDPAFMSCYAVGYRTGYRSYDPVYLEEHDPEFPDEAYLTDTAIGIAGTLARELGPFSFPTYQKGSLRGVADRDAGMPYNPLSEDGVEPGMGDREETYWLEGYHDGYQGGRAAGTLEGEADRNNGKPFRPPSGLGALSDFAIGYRTAYRPVPAFFEVDASDFEGPGGAKERHRLEHSILVFEIFGFEEFEDGRAAGMADRQNGEPAKDATPFVAGYLAHHYSPFVSGYRDGYGPENRRNDYEFGHWEGQRDRNGGGPAKEHRGDSLRDAGYRAGFHEYPSALRPAVPRAEGDCRPRAVVVKKRRTLRSPKPDTGA